VNLNEVDIAELIKKVFEILSRSFRRHVFDQNPPNIFVFTVTVTRILQRIGSSVLNPNFTTHESEKQGGQFDPFLKLFLLWMLDLGLNPPTALLAEHSLGSLSFLTRLNEIRLPPSYGNILVLGMDIWIPHVNACVHKATMHLLNNYSNHLKTELVRKLNGLSWSGSGMVTRQPLEHQTQLVRISDPSNFTLKLI
jgi:hypothetical protein